MESMLASFIITALDAMMGATAMILAMLYYLGLQHCRGSNGEGRTIMRAIVVFWVGFSLFCFGQMYFELMKFLEDKLCSNTIHLIFQICLNSMLMVSLAYYVWATIRRNPPKADESSMGILRHHSG